MQPNLQQPAVEHASTLSFHLCEDRKIVFTSFIPVKVEKTWGELGRNILHRNIVTSFAGTEGDPSEVCRLADKCLDTTAPLSSGWLWKAFTFPLSPSSSTCCCCCCCKILINIFYRSCHFQLMESQLLLSLIRSAGWGLS